MTVSQAINQHIRESGIKQTALAEKCGWPKQKMNAIVRERQTLSSDDYGCICDALDVPYDFFYNLASNAVSA